MLEPESIHDARSVVGTLTPPAAVAQWQLFDLLTDDEYVALKASIREHGILVPVEQDEHGVILDGHHRVRAWTELRAEGVALPDYPRMIRVGLDDAAKRRHVIMLNLYRRHLGPEQRACFVRELRADGLTLQQIAGAAGVDAATVHRDLARESEIADANSAPATVTNARGQQRPARYKPRGLSRTAIATSRYQVRKIADAAEAGAFADLPLGAVVAHDHPAVHAGARETRRERGASSVDAVPLTMPADVTLVEHDARQRWPLGDDTVDLIVTSPPYGLDIAYEGGDVEATVWAGFMLRWLSEARRVAKPRGRLALNVPLDTFKGGCRATYAEAVTAAMAAGWSYRSTIVWTDNERGKNTARGSVDSPSAPYVYAPAEMIALFSAGEWGLEDRAAPDIEHADWLAWTDGAWSMRGEVSPWEGHPAPFTVALARRLILLLSYPGDTVLDPFVGSGTTALAAHRLGRTAIGFDVSGQYIASARRRLGQERGADAPCRIS